MNVWNYFVFRLKISSRNFSVYYSKEREVSQCSIVVHRSIKYTQWQMFIRYYHKYTFRFLYCFVLYSSTFSRLENAQYIEIHKLKKKDRNICTGIWCWSIFLWIDMEIAFYAVKFPSIQYTCNGICKVLIS